jgi:hypothetical protein
MSAFGVKADIETRGQDVPGLDFGPTRFCNIGIK